MSSLGSVRSLLFDPDAFYEREPSLGGALAIVGLLAVYLFAFVSYFLGWMGTNAPSSVISEARSILFVGVLVGVPVAWLLIAGIAHVVSSFVGGSGSFDRTFTNVGWAFAPELVVSPIQFGLLVYFTSTTDPPATVEEASTIETMLYQDPVMQLAAIVGIVATVWQIWLWLYALAHARNLSKEEAAVAVAIPALWVLYDSLTNLSG